MTNITQAMIEASYKYGKMYANIEITKKEAINRIVSETGMNESTAKNRIEIMDCLLKEKIYFHTMSANETILKLEKIIKDYRNE